MARIELDSLRKDFAETTAVDDITLSVADGEFLVLVGPSGCGKSTLLRTISGLEEQTGGEIRIGGEVVTDTAPKNRGVAMVFQNYALYPHMSARRNMTFGLGSHGSFTDEEIERMVADVAAILDIEDLLDRRPGELSGGEKQRVAMGRAILREPEVFLLDEPLSNLDAKLRDEMRTELTHLHGEIEATTVYVTHDQTEAMTLGDRVAVMNEGQIEQIDTPRQLYDFPQSQFVAEFIGSPKMNLFEGQVTTSPDGVRLQSGAFDTVLADRPRVSADERSIIGIRPEDLYLASGAAGQQYSDPFELTVTLTETLGDSVVLYATDGDTTFRIRTSARQGVATGDEISVVTDSSRVHLFDPETGDAVFHSGESDAATQQTVTQ